MQARPDAEVVLIKVLLFIDLLFDGLHLGYNIAIVIPNCKIERSRNKSEESLGNQKDASFRCGTFIMTRY